mmetsp:Transcript_31749/g.55814  ORF Transcript_31749/g.55814 Transcript_31749/m.55814 type:complete len:602 (-) Transcript_31749:119-1924(-)|eukprot:CAMPEP_0197520368 /NCGR_PEP_ID=MMETSP1318-20131121/5702_1 /TAXON_ID=552666 /ORGANISM="Partenskyella glossopodia, Strain RCC365" /LENGTH=601 /DNA_ID=CAMNT_0043071891 /DNA_START=132 /DNA_END=1937 /DNA_ORIENTATION=-
MRTHLHMLVRSTASRVSARVGRRLGGDRVWLPKAATVSSSSSSSSSGYRCRYRHVASLSSSSAAAASTSMYTSNHIHNINDDKTIFQVSSGFESCGVCVIRVSGSGAQDAYKKLTRRRKLPSPRKATLVDLKDRNGDILDVNSLCLYFPAPHSYTGEPIIEFHVHGNPSLVSNLMHELALFDGFRTAEAGEFTRRAFENGKLDLMQVEGLSDLLSSSTQAQRSLAIQHINGTATSVVLDWKEEVVGCLAHLEAVVDFADDELDVDENRITSDIKARLSRLQEQLKNAIDDSERGEMIRSGMDICIVGPPNVGKSSLLNLLSKSDKAITSNIPGTTRDVIEVSINLGGYKVTLFDTAGIRQETRDPIEKVGIGRSMDSLRSAALRLLVLDISSVGDEDADAAAAADVVVVDDDDDVLALSSDCLSSGPTMLLINKQDTKASDVCLESVRSSFVSKITENCQGDDQARDNLLGSLMLSCKDKTGISEVVAEIQHFVKACLAPPQLRDQPNHNSHVHSLDDRIKHSSNKNNNNAIEIITRVRHKQHIENCEAALCCALEHIESKDLELAAEEMRRAVHEIAAILGRVDVEQLLDVIFRDFCIGK